MFCARLERGTFRSQTLQLAPNCSVLIYWAGLSSVWRISQWLPCSDGTTFYRLIDFSFSSIQWTLSPPSKLEIMMNPFRGREVVEEGSCSCWTYNIECVRDVRTIRQESYVSCRHSTYLAFHITALPSSHVPGVYIHQLLSFRFCMPTSLNYVLSMVLEKDGQDQLEWSCETLRIINYYMQTRGRGTFYIQ